MFARYLWEKRTGRRNMDYGVTPGIVNFVYLFVLGALATGAFAQPKGVDLSPAFQSKYNNYSKTDTKSVVIMTD